MALGGPSVISSLHPPSHQGGKVGSMKSSQKDAKPQTGMSLGRKMGPARVHEKATETSTDRSYTRRWSPLRSWARRHEQAGLFAATLANGLGLRYSTPPYSCDFRQVSQLHNMLSKEKRRKLANNSPHLVREKDRPVRK